MITDAPVPPVLANLGAHDPPSRRTPPPPGDTIKSPSRDPGRATDLPGAELVWAELQAVEAALRRHPSPGVPPIPEVGAHLLEAGGKRLRPLVLLLSARAHGVSPEQATALAAAAELLHTASLLHDDVVDEASRRRGKTAARLLWGNAATVLAGDYFLSRGLCTLATLGDPRPVATLSKVVADLAEGELLQLARRGKVLLDEETYFAVVRRKTASLMAWCARVGGLLDPAADAAMQAYGDALGVAFQITDDLLDVVGDPETTGKDLGADLREGKLTLPLLIACRLRPTLIHDLRALATATGNVTALQSQTLRAVVESGAESQVRQRAQEAARTACRALDPLPPSPERDALANLALRCAERAG